MTTRILIASALLALPAAAPAQVPTADLSINLVCHGQGEVRKTGPSTYRDKDGKPKTRYLTERTPVDGVVQVRIRPGEAQAMLPHALVGVYSGGQWRDIKKLSVTPNAVDGKVEIALLYAPKLHIDRSTGTLTINGSQSDFTAQCRASDPRDRVF